MSTRAEFQFNIKPLMTQNDVNYTSGVGTYINSVFVLSKNDSKKVESENTQNTKNGKNYLSVDDCYENCKYAFEKLGLSVEEAKKLKILENIIGGHPSRKGYSKRELELAMVSLGDALGDVGGTIKKTYRKVVRSVVGLFKNDKTSEIEALISKANKIYNQKELESIDVKKELEEMISLEAKAKLDEKTRFRLFVKTRRVFRVKLGLSIEDMKDTEKVKQATRNFVKNKIAELDGLKGEARTAKWKETENDIATLLRIASKYPELAEYMPILVSALPSDKRAEILKLSKDAICKNQEASSKYALSVIENFEAIGETDANGNKISEEEYAKISYDTWKDMNEKTFKKGLEIVGEKAEALFGSRDEIIKIREKLINKEELTPEEREKWSQYINIQRIIEKKNNGEELTPDEEKLYARYNSIVTLNSTAQIATRTNTNLSEQAAVKFREELSKAAHDYEYSNEVASHIESFLNEHKEEFSEDVINGIKSSIETARENSKTETSYFSQGENTHEYSDKNEVPNVAGENNTVSTNVSQDEVENVSANNTVNYTQNITQNTPQNPNTVSTTNTNTNVKKATKPHEDPRKDLGSTLNKTTITPKTNNTDAVRTSLADCKTPEEVEKYKKAMGYDKFFTEVLETGNSNYLKDCEKYIRALATTKKVDFLNGLILGAFSDALSLLTVKDFKELEGFSWRTEAYANVFETAYEVAKEKENKKDLV